jgi:allantoin racemase
MAPGLVKKAIEAEDRGFDAVMTVCLYDFGVEAARHVVDIPVVATGAATCHVASLMVDRVGVLAPTTAGIPITYKVLRNNGLQGNRVAPIRGVDLPVQDLWNRKDELKTKILSMFQKTVEEGAQVCWIQGSLLIPFAISAQDVQKELTVPVLDPIGIGVKMCELLVGVGYKNSRACYPFTCRPNPKDLL